MEKKLEYIIFCAVIVWSLNQGLLYGQSPTYDLDWSTYNDNNNGVNGMVMVSNAALADAEGNLYLSYNDFFSRSSIDKFSSSGELLWRIDFNEDDTTIVIDDLKMDHNQDLIICGWTNSPHLFGTPGAWQEENAGLHDRFLAKLDAQTGTIIWSTYFGGPADDEDGVGDYTREYNSLIAITDSNDIVWTTNMRSEDMGTPNVFQEQRNAEEVNYVISKFDTNGQRIWTTYYGYNQSIISGLQVDTSGVYVAGLTRSGSNFLDPYFDTSGTWTVSPYSSKAYISKFDHTGNRLWSYYFGGEGAEYLLKNSLAQTADELYLTGSTTSSTGITSEGTFLPSMDIVNNVGYLVQFDKEGTYQWGTYVGASDYTTVYAGNGSKNIYVAGNTKTDEILSTPYAHQESLNGPSDAFILEFDDNGQRLFGTYFGGEKDENGLHVLLSPAPDGFYLTGLTNSLTGIATPGAHQETFPGDPDSPGPMYLFIAKFLEGPLKVEDLDSCNGFKIYPNPATSIITLGLDCPFTDYNLSIYNLLGQKVLSFKSSDNLNQMVDISELAPGTYILQLRNGEGVFNTSFIKN